MSLLDNLLERFGYVKAGSKASPLVDSVTQWDMPPLEQVATHADLYRVLSWVQIAVSYVANTAANAALQVEKRVGEDKEELIDHPFERLLRAPNPYQSRSEFMIGTISAYKLTGNAYWWANRPNANAETEELWLLPPQCVTPVPDGHRGVKGYIYTDETNMNPRPLEAWEVVHFKNYNPNSTYVGMSFVEAAQNVALSDLAMQKWNLNYFQKDNAKMPGILAFADPIPDSEWETMKASIREQQGGVQRRMMMLRNVKKGGVEWITTAISQKDMEFLQARQFNKEEIFDLIAPALAPILAINTTEANSKAAKSTFLEGVWSMLTAISQKIDGTLLPAYGENLTACFEDIRPVDRALQLAEQEAFSKVHTVAEIRAEYYADKPLGDERDDLTLVELAKYTPAPDEPPTPPVDAAMLERLQQPPAMPTMEEKEAPAMEEMEDDESEESAYKKAFLDELSQMRTFYLSRAKAGKKPNREFETTVIDPVLKASMLQALENCDSVEGVKRVFTDARGWIHG